jgi:hypothetical protein
LAHVFEPEIVLGDGMWFGLFYSQKTLPSDEDAIRQLGMEAEHQLNYGDATAVRELR